MISNSRAAPPLRVDRTKSQGKTWDFVRYVTFSLLIFTVTAMAAVPAAYARSDAILKFTVIITAILLFYGMLILGAASPGKIAPALSLLGASLAVLFLLVHDWSAQPADYGFINRLAAAWTALRPHWLAVDARSSTFSGALARQLSQNVAGGLLASFLPFSAAWAFDGWRASKRKTGRAARLAAVLCAAVCIFALLLSSSRAAFLALGGAMALWLVWRGSDRLSQPFHRWRIPGLAIITTAVFVFGGLALLMRSGTMITLFDRTPGFPSAASRSQIASNALRLAGDFPLLGGGLHAFPGLYSTYMQSIPYYLFAYSHNLYLDIAIEQGVLGLFAMVAILAGSIMVSFQAGEAGGPQPAARLGQAVFVGLVSMVLHGLADDAFYGEYGTPFLFVLPAAAAAAARLAQQDRPLLPSGNANRAPRRSIRWIGGAALIVLAAISIFGRSLFSLALANLGAVRMARVQLADFPAGAWDEKLTSNALDQAEDLLQQSLAWNPRNRSANQRLGLIAMLRWDFQAACPFLQKAYQADPGHRGVVKNLGYCLAWTAQYGEALPYLARIPEARQELSAYAGWWLARGHSDLAENARRMRTLLTNEVKP